MTNRWESACTDRSCAVHRLAVASLLLAAGTLTACSSSSRPELPLRVVQPVVDLGRVPPGTPVVKQAFTLKVWQRSAVKITSVTHTCGCMGVMPSLEGKELPAGSEHEVLVSLAPEVAVGAGPFIVTIRTEPASVEPITMTLLAKVGGRLSVEPSQPVYTGVPGHRLQGTLRLHYFREVGGAALRLNKRRCRLGGLELVQVESVTRNVPGPPGSIEEQTDSVLLTLAAPHELPIGEHHYEVELVFRGDVPPRTVPITLRVEHPLRPKLARLFCGSLKTGERWSLEVDLLRHPKATVSVQSVSADAEFVRVQLVEGDRLHVEVTAPPTEGRFEAQVLLRYSDPNIPQIVVPVSGMVSSN